MTNSVYLYAGPSLYECGVKDISKEDDIHWRPPVRRGDIEKLCSEISSPTTIAIADGTFHSYPSVGHEEIRVAMERGWTVYGLCSMGAIRAAEMMHLGMIPFGSVANRFCTERDFSDDEVCLVHSNEQPYFPFSEPLIHCRAFLDALVKRKSLNGPKAQSVANALKSRWYGDRTLQALRIELNKVLPSSDWNDSIEDDLHKFGKYRLKQADLFSFVSTRAWESSNK